MHRSACFGRFGPEPKHTYLVYCDTPMEQNGAVLIWVEMVERTEDGKSQDGR